MKNEELKKEFTDEKTGSVFFISSVKLLLAFNCSTNSFTLACVLSCTSFKY